MANVCFEFRQNPTVNPRTKRQISPGSKTYNVLMKECGTPNQTMTTLFPTTQTVAPSPFFVLGQTQPITIPQHHPSIAVPPVRVTTQIPTPRVPSPTRTPMAIPTFPTQATISVPMPASPQRIQTRLVYQPTGRIYPAGTAIAELPPDVQTMFQTYRPASPQRMTIATLPTMMTAPAMVTMRPSSPPVPTMPTMPTMRPASPRVTIATMPTMVTVPTMPTMRPTLPQATIATMPTMPTMRPASPRVTPARTGLAINDNVNDATRNNFYGVSQIQQRSSEDRYQVKRIGPFRYYAVFDGHGGTRRMGPQHVADYAVVHLHERLAQALAVVDLNSTELVSEVIKQTFVSFDREMYEMGLKYGSTATIVMIDDDRNIIYQVNLGDSRSIMFDSNSIISATDDHDADAPVEQARVEKAGGFVTGGRVIGQLMVGRALGDYDYKNNNEIPYDPVNGMVSAVPDVKILRKPTNDYYIILTSDAPYERNAFSDTTLIQLFARNTTGLTVNTQVPEQLFASTASNMATTIQPRTTDDITIMVVANGMRR